MEEHVRQVTLEEASPSGVSQNQSKLLRTLALARKVHTLPKRHAPAQSCPAQRKLHRRLALTSPSDKSAVSVTSKAIGSQTRDGALGWGRAPRVTVLSSSIGSQHRSREEGNRSSSSKSNSNSNSRTSATAALVADCNEAGACLSGSGPDREAARGSVSCPGHEIPTGSLTTGNGRDDAPPPIGGRGGHGWPTGSIVDVESTTLCCRGGGPAKSGERGRLQMGAR
jgi:hypothetical protein